MLRNSARWRSCSSSGPRSCMVTTNDSTASPSNFDRRRVDQHRHAPTVAHRQLHLLGAQRGRVAQQRLQRELAQGDLLPVGEPEGHLRQQFFPRSGPDRAGRPLSPLPPDCSTPGARAWHRSPPPPPAWSRWPGRAARHGTCGRSRSPSSPARRTVKPELPEHRRQQPRSARPLPRKVSFSPHPG